MTREAHDQVDGLLGGFDLGARPDYVRFLVTQAAAFLPVERALDRADASAIIPDWSERRRGDCLREDFADLGVAPDQPIDAPVFDSPETLLGGAYVLEGSRLGGKMLSRSIGGGLPQRFLAGPPLGGGWKALIALLERELPSPGQREIAGRSAIATFDCFFRAASVSVCPR